MFGGKFSFNYDGKEYKFKLPAKAEKFVDFFRKVKARGWQDEEITKIYSDFRNSNVMRWF